MAYSTHIQQVLAYLKGGNKILPPAGTVLPTAPQTAPTAPFGKPTLPMTNPKPVK